MLSGSPVFGWRAGSRAAKVAGECHSSNGNSAALEGLTEAIARFTGARGEKSPGELRPALQKTMWKKPLVEKDAESLSRARNFIAAERARLQTDLLVSAPTPRRQSTSWLLWEKSRNGAWEYLFQRFPKLVSVRPAPLQASVSRRLRRHFQIPTNQLTSRTVINPIATPRRAMPTTRRYRRRRSVLVRSVELYRYLVASSMPALANLGVFR
jgi:hypothetical protein